MVDLCFYVDGQIHDVPGSSWVVVVMLMWTFGGLRAQDGARRLGGYAGFGLHLIAIDNADQRASIGSSFEIGTRFSMFYAGGTLGALVSTHADNSPTISYARNIGFLYGVHFGVRVFDHSPRFYAGIIAVGCKQTINLYVHYNGGGGPNELHLQTDDLQSKRIPTLCSTRRLRAHSD
jgi:hypothetical protein